ncbi:hypothetical protein [Synechococcus sp. UW140]|uniref:hypothetical protein n=1 Tax=Synechococcus sp. UW140 TaxID=368503 RepID=UPI0010BD4986|nr:hypothetical protein [Synechococcus sp. UW140]
MRKALTALVKVATVCGGEGFAQRLLISLVGATPGWSGLHREVARLCAKRRWFDAVIRIGKQTLPERSSDHQLRLIVADSCYASRRYVEALQHAKVLIEVVPTSFDGYHIACESLQLLGRPTEAIATLEEGCRHCLDGEQLLGTVRSRHVHRHLQAYLKRDQVPLYGLWSEAIVHGDATAGVDEAVDQPRQPLFRPQPFQYWSQGTPPQDVIAITEQWNGLFEHLGLKSIMVFGRDQALEWITRHNPDFRIAFETAPHYAAESDVFRLAYASCGDTIWLDSDVMPVATSWRVLDLSLQCHSSLLYLKKRVPYLQSSFFLSRQGCPFFAELANGLRGFDYSDPRFQSVGKLQLIHDCSFGPASYTAALERLCANVPFTGFDHASLPLMQRVLFPAFSLSFFRGNWMVRGGPLSYKQSADNWKVWARS